MAIRVEFYGIARQRAGISDVQVDMTAREMRLRDVLSELTSRIPELGGELICGEKLHESVTANIDGARFVRDPATLIQDGQCLLILSADAGG
jgi:molybdopterin converting factor small subunit